VLVGEPGLLAAARAGLDRFTVVEAGDRPWRGRDVVALLVTDRQPVGEDDLARLPSLQVIVSATVGLDHVPLEAAAARGIEVRHVPDYCTEEMADSTIALLLALLRGVVDLDRSVRLGGWDPAAAGPLRRVAGTRLGVVGFGRIGRAVARRALGLGCEVWGSDPFVPAPELSAAGVRAVGLDELLAACDAVTLHAPLTPATDGLIGTRELELMTAGAVLVNTARGGLVDLDALLAALRSGRLRGAALDVLPEEPPADVPAAPGLIVTPHAAWYSPEAEREAASRAIAELRDALGGTTFRLG
jgi:phosphoglycerate dehydrogenase-like enzyme